MPNYCMNRLTFSGSVEKVDKLFQFVRGDSDFDFQKITPMPQSIQDTEHGSVSFASEACALYLKDGTITNQLRWMIERYDIDQNNLKDAINQWVSVGQVNLGMGERILQNKIDYGYGDWYDWAVAKWGTKWNSSDVDVEDSDITFTTAWSPPRPVIEKLSELFPSIEITHIYFEPGTELAGEDVYYGGNPVVNNLFDANEEGYRIIEERVYGDYSGCDDKLVGDWSYDQLSSNIWVGSNSDMNVTIGVDLSPVRDSSHFTIVESAPVVDLSRRKFNEQW